MTDLPEMKDKGTMTVYELEEEQLDLRWEFPYGVDKSIQVVESEIFDFDKESFPIVSELCDFVLYQALKEVNREREIR